MRPFYLSLAILVAAAPLANAQSDEALIRAARAASNRGIAAHDLGAVSSVWLPEFHQMMSTNAQATGRDAARATISALFESRPDVVYLRTPTSITVNKSWGQAAENGRWTGHWTQKDGVTRVGGTYFAKWKKVEGNWKLLAETFVQTSCTGTSYCTAPPALGAQALAAAIDEIAHRPDLVHATFGVAAFDLDTKRAVFELNAEQLFTPGSTTKLLTTGTALGVLGADYRFHTPVYRTGPIVGGVLAGDLVLVASGDPNLSGRTLGDTLGFANEDHSYAGRGDSVAKIIGDPLLVMRELAGQIATAGVRRVDGRVLVDASLFTQGDRELGTGVVISPAVLNDNVVDLLITAGAATGDSVRVRLTPDLGIYRVVNEVTTAAAGTRPTMRRAIQRDSSTGVTTVRLAGTLAAGAAPLVMSIPVDDPADLTARALAAALRERGIAVSATGVATQPPDLADSLRMGEHVSLPLGEAVKVVLKVSQNLHASALPYILGAVAGKTRGRGALQAGFDAEREFLQRAGLDLIAASQGDGAGGSPAAFYSPNFMVRYLAYMEGRPDSATFRRALPILGRDGTLWNIQPQSAAAGHVFAKTGTFSLNDPLNRRTVITGKGLAGYMTTASGRRLAFAIYANRIPFPPNYVGDASLLVGQALGEIANAMYERLP